MVAPRPFEILSTFVNDAVEMRMARQKALILHRTKDIRAAGNEIEETAKQLLKRRLPSMYSSGSGHIIDSKLNVNPQYDVIIADIHSSPTLLRSADGTCYFPYESVYAIGEVKSAYYEDKNYIGAFAGNIKNLRQKLSRRVNGLLNGMQPHYSYSNPLFSFMLFVDSNDFEIGDVASLYSTEAALNLPNIVCFLDKGLIVYKGQQKSPKGEVIEGGIHVIPEFANSKMFTEPRWNWRLMTFGTGDEACGRNYAAFYFYLLEHLRNCNLLEPEMTSYLGSVLGAPVVEDAVSPMPAPSVSPTTAPAPSSPPAVPPGAA